MPDIATTLRKQIEASHRTLYRISQDTGIAHPVLWRFVNEQNELRTDTASKLFEYFGIKIKSP